jgi:hypothetical protein
MILTNRQSLHSLPETLVILFLGALMLATIGVMYYSEKSYPVVFVPGAKGYGVISPLVGDKEYALKTAERFIVNWYVWRYESYSYKRKRAIELFMPEIQNHFIHTTGQSYTMIRATQQRQSFTIQSLEVNNFQDSETAFIVTYKGIRRRYFGAIGGNNDDDIVEGSLILERRKPDESNSIAMEIVLFSEKTPKDTSDLSGYIDPEVFAMLGHPIVSDSATHSTEKE